MISYNYDVKDHSVASHFLPELNPERPRKEQQTTNHTSPAFIVITSKQQKKPPGIAEKGERTKNNTEKRGYLRKKKNMSQTKSESLTFQKRNFGKQCKQGAFHWRMAESTYSGIATPPVSFYPWNQPSSQSQWLFRPETTSWVGDFSDKPKELFGYTMNHQLYECEFTLTIDTSNYNLNDLCFGRNWPIISKVESKPHWK